MVGWRTHHWGGGWLLSSAPEFALICQLFLNGGEVNGTRILGKKTIDLMLANHMAGIPNLQAVAAVVERDPAGEPGAHVAHPQPADQCRGRRSRRGRRGPCPRRRAFGRDYSVANPTRLVGRRSRPRSRPRPRTGQQPVPVRRRTRRRRLPVSLPCW
jgi:CubicO group peptidase (beta-lactamase class C family)